MKKVISISVITCLLLFSCETAKQEAKPSDNSQVQLAQPSTETNAEDESETSNEIETISQEEDAADNNTLESENNSQEAAFEEKIEENNPYTEEQISDEEIAEDLSEKKTDVAAAENSTAENITTSNTAAANNEAAPKPAQDSTAKINTAQNSAPLQKPAADNKPAANNSTAKPASSNTAANTKPADNKPAAADITEPKTLQQELSEASDSIKEENHAPVPSRGMQIKNHQFIDVAYPGTGWVYLGEVEKQNLFVFFGRKIENGETVFTLQPKKAGDATLHFYKNDPLSQTYIDDYMTVSVSTESATDSTHEKAPLYASVVPPKPEKVVKVAAAENAGEEIPSEKNSSSSAPKLRKGTTSYSNETESDPSNIQTRISKSDNVGEAVPEFTTAENKEETTVTSGDLLDAAQKAYNDKKYPEALSLVRDFFLTTSNRIDEGLFLEAQILEAKSPVQNIKGSIADYDTIVNKWPASRLWKKANERSIYLKRFYIDIR